MENTLSKIDEEAIVWLTRLDRGLSQVEADDFFDWLSDDPLHEERFKIAKSNWKALDNLAVLKDDPESVDELGDFELPKKRKWLWVGSLVAVAACALFAIIVNSPVVPEKEQPHILRLSYNEENRYRLEDGTLIKLAEFSTILVSYSTQERRVFLESGECFFDVAKDTSRPFIVSVADVEVSAVGTAFNINYSQVELQVVVTEGRVAITKNTFDVKSDTSEDVESIATYLDRNQTVIIPIAENIVHQPVVTDLQPDQVRDILQWQHGLITFKSEPLSDTVNEFNQLNETQLIITDPDLENILISGTFRSDNLHGFVKALEVGFGIEAQYFNSKEILLK
ncbi:MAG: FecR domain-containing protein [Opitutales bacterium]|nr:FecR domain-containing protein [Opitutales bacterium]